MYTQFMTGCNLIYHKVHECHMLWMHESLGDLIGSLRISHHRASWIIKPTRHGQSLSSITFNVMNKCNNYDKGNLISKICPHDLFNFV